jgi:hypothetical protein
LREDGGLRHGAAKTRANALKAQPALRTVDAILRIAYLAKCDSSYCAPPAPAARVFDFGGGALKIA